MEGNELKDLIFKRLHITPQELHCPRETSGMTPCVARDGDLAMTDTKHCAGCNASVAELIKIETIKPTS